MQRPRNANARPKYPPIADYGLIGVCRAAALASRDTVAAIRDELETEHHLIYRFDPREMEGGEGTFVAFASWLAECLARQDALDDAREVFDAAVSTSKGLAG